MGPASSRGKALPGAGGARQDVVSAQPSPAWSRWKLILEPEPQLSLSWDRWKSQAPGPPGAMVARAISPLLVPLPEKSPLGKKRSTSWMTSYFPQTHPEVSELLSPPVHSWRRDTSLGASQGPMFRLLKDAQRKTSGSCQVCPPWLLDPIAVPPTWTQ